MMCGGVILGLALEPWIAWTWPAAALEGAWAWLVGPAYGFVVAQTGWSGLLYMTVRILHAVAPVATGY